MTTTSASFDDRIEVRSTGTFPTGISAESLASDHLSVRRNPLIAGAFHRTEPLSSKQRYRTTAAGLELFKESKATQ